MIERYKSEIVEKIWNEQAKFDRWAAVEVAACKAFRSRGEISDEDFEQINNAEFPKVERIKEIEKKTDHDVVAFVRAFSENIGEPACRHIHRGLTSSDICDTAQAMAMRDSVVALVKEILILLDNYLIPLAVKHKHTPCIGRTHGVHAEVTTFGIRIVGWVAELRRCIHQLMDLCAEVSYAKLSGAVGTYSQTDPDFEKEALSELSLVVEPIATQVVPRDRHARLLSELSMLGCAFERIALEVRSLQRTEIREVEEGFKKGQTGSSAMPHKRNPISSEKVCGLARVLRANMLVGHENVALWHDRDISHSSAERIVLPDSFHMVFHMIKVMKKIFGNLQIFPGNMMKNIMKTNGLVMSQSVLGLLLKRGMTRERAYSIVQRAAKLVWDNDMRFREALIEQDVLTEVEIDSALSIEHCLKHVDEIFNRVLKWH